MVWLGWVALVVLVALVALVVDFYCCVVLSLCVVLPGVERYGGFKVGFNHTDTPSSGAAAVALPKGSTGKVSFKKRKKKKKK